MAGEVEPNPEKISYLKNRWSQLKCTGDWSKDQKAWLRIGETADSYILANTINDRELDSCLIKLSGKGFGKLPNVGSYISDLFELLNYQFAQETLLEYARRKEVERFNRRQRWCRANGDPVVLDLKGSGRIDTLNVNDGTYCDYNGDGCAEATGWVSPDAGILVMDRNGNGLVDNGSELFGNFTPLPNGQLAADGFQALAALDSNGDGKIDSQDPAYSQLRVWANPSDDGKWTTLLTVAVDCANGRSKSNRGV